MFEPDTCKSVVCDTCSLEDFGRHPKTEWQFSMEHNTEQFPEDKWINVPDGHGISQDEPKYPGLQSAKKYWYSN